MQGRFSLLYRWFEKTKSDYWKSKNLFTFIMTSGLLKIFSNITSLGFKYDSYNLHHHIVIATPHNSYNISRKKVSKMI